MSLLLIAWVVTLIAIGAGLLYFKIRKPAVPPAPAGPVPHAQGAAQAAQQQPRLRRGAVQRQAPAADVRPAAEAPAAGPAAAAAAAAAPEAESENEDNAEPDYGPDGKLTAAARRRQEKAARKAQREAMLAAEAEKAKKLDAKQDKYRQKEAEREAARQEQLKAEADARAVKERQESDEYDKWKNMFSVGEAGNDIAGIEGGQEDQLARFVEYIESRKVVQIDELAAEFGLRTVDVVNRIKELEASGRLTGILDDRGKFIFISTAESKAVAAFIMKRGRVNIAEVTKECNLIISLQSA